MDHLENTRYIFNKYAASYKEKYLDQQEYAPVLKSFVSRLPQGSRVLDLGCGPGNVSRFLLDQRHDLQLTGIDLAPAMITEAQKLNPEASFHISNILELDPSELNSFQGVISSFVLPYLGKEQVEKHLVQCKQVLSPGGLVYLSFLEGKSEDSGFRSSSSADEGDSLYMHFYPEITVRKLIEETGFKVDEAAKKTPRSQNGEPTNNEIMMILRWS